MTKTTPQITLQHRPQPRWYKVLVPLLYALPYLFLVAMLLLLVPGCNRAEPESRFELNLQSSVFGDIVIEQGGENSSQLTINRSVRPGTFPAAIELSLVDAPEWLSYRFENNPVASDADVLTLSVAEHADPGIYRVQLLGTGTLGEFDITDSFTFHIKVTSSRANRQSANNVADSLSFLQHWFN